VRSSRPDGRGRPRPTAAPHVGPAQPRHHHTCPVGSVSPGRSARAPPRSGPGAGRRRRRRDDNHRAWPGGISSTASVGSKCSGPTTTASSGQSGRGTSRAGRVAMRRRSGPGSTAGKPISTLAADRWRRPWRHDRAVSARITESRSGRGPRRRAPTRCPAAAGPSTAGTAGTG
jgi:hypothetical protein